MNSRLPQRGTNGDRAKFAENFVTSRMAGFKKDMKICLTPILSETRSGPTHAYFPALASCCGTLEYLSALYTGRVNGLGWKDVYRWASIYLPQPDYNSETIRILVQAFRNAVAHRGIASGVWTDQKPGPSKGWRLTWKIYANSTRPSIRIIKEDGVIKNDPPWECKITHRVHIHLKSMELDIRKGAEGFAKDFISKPELIKPFYSCMNKLYPK
ncbi:hypothetical protein [Candidatus Thiodiazotropha sp. CDECU1]|uniref:hypothetical protein n=1 Tax=Candidatus Thiodiazotropha sp. CDECU1 TaxID=3065865 RepID=UPI0029319C27|nr:hypothetical protein [Candidatus Thiodiazotropha sp. CDECU1]